MMLSLEMVLSTFLTFAAFVLEWVTIGKRKRSALMESFVIMPADIFMLTLGFELTYIINNRYEDLGKGFALFLTSVLFGPCIYIICCYSKEVLTFHAEEKKISLRVSCITSYLMSLALYFYTVHISFK